jgi:hypothetical protein
VLARHQSQAVALGASTAILGAACRPQPHPQPPSPPTTALTAVSCPTTRLCSSSDKWSSLSRSVCCSRVVGMPRPGRGWGRGRGAQRLGPRATRFADAETQHGRPPGSSDRTPAPTGPTASPLSGHPPVQRLTTSAICSVLTSSASMGSAGMAARWRLSVSSTSAMLQGMGGGVRGQASAPAGRRTQGKAGSRWLEEVPAAALSPRPASTPPPPRPSPAVADVCHARQVAALLRLL